MAFVIEMVERHNERNVSFLAISDVFGQYPVFEAKKALFFPTKNDAGEAVQMIADINVIETRAGDYIINGIKEIDASKI